MSEKKSLLARETIEEKDEIKIDEVKDVLEHIEENNKLNEDDETILKSLRGNI